MMRYSIRKHIPLLLKYKSACLAREPMAQQFWVLLNNSSPKPDKFLSSFYDTLDHLLAGTLNVLNVPNPLKSFRIVNDNASLIISKTTLNSEPHLQVGWLMRIHVMHRKLIESWLVYYTWKTLIKTSQRWGA